MHAFFLWFSTGLQHILNGGAYDHLLFVILLCLSHPPAAWKKLLLLITAFTLGHSLSLAVSVIQNFHASPAMIEFLIALTILLSALFLIYQHFSSRKGSVIKLLFLVVFFGLIHGLGFASFLQAMLGREQSLILPLLYFNLGIEAGQLIIVLLFLVFSLLLTRLFKWPFKSYKFTILCIISILASKIVAERFLDFF